MRRRPAVRAEVEEDDRERGREEPEAASDPRLIDGFEKGEQLRCPGGVQARSCSEWPGSCRISVCEVPPI